MKNPALPLLLATILAGACMNRESPTEPRPLPTPTPGPCPPEWTLEPYSGCMPPAQPTATPTPTPKG